MTITISLWMLVPALLVVGGIVLLFIGARQSGLLAGLFEGVLALALFAIAGAFLLVRWLA